MGDSDEGEGGEIGVVVLGMGRPPARSGDGMAAC